MNEKELIEKEKLEKEIKNTFNDIKIIVKASLLGVLILSIIALINVLTIIRRYYLG